MKKDIFLIFGYANENFGYSVYSDARHDNWMCDALITDSMAKECGYNSAFALLCALVGDSEVVTRIKHGTRWEGEQMPDFQTMIETNEDGTFTLKDIVQQVTARNNNG